jgi:hypothetical protein
MELLKPLGKRDIFGIVLPGTIVVFAVAYALFGFCSLLQLQIGDLLDQQILLSVILFVTAYLVGSVLRLVAADDVDKKSSESLMKAWREEHKAQADHAYLQSLQKCKAELSRGNEVVSVPDGFDEWLPQVEDFPYPAWQNRKWQAVDLREPLTFYRDHYRSSMWSERTTSPKSFFNFCKLAVIGGDGALAEEINMAEGLSRFFAGTVIALKISIWLIAVSLAGQLALAGAFTLAPHFGVKPQLSIKWISQGFYFVLTLGFVFALVLIRRKIVRRFRYVRLKEAGTVYHAFYLYSKLSAERVQKEGQEESRVTLLGRLRNLFIG